MVHACLSRIVLTASATPQPDDEQQHYNMLYISFHSNIIYQYYNYKKCFLLPLRNIAQHTRHIMYMIMEHSVIVAPDGILA